MSRDSSWWSLRWTGFAVAGVAGAVVWALSPWLTGRAEAWDAPRYYFLALLVAGLVAGLAAGRPLWRLYVGAVLGQVLYMLIALPLGPLLPIGVVILLVFTLLFLAAATLGWAVRQAVLPAPPR